MDLDGPKSPESMSMEIDDGGGVSDSHMQPVQTSSSSDLSGHPFAGSNAPFLLSPRPTNHPGEAGDILHMDHGLARWQRTDRLPTGSQPSRPEAAESRKRKIARLSPQADHSDLTRDAHPSANVAAEASTTSSSSSSRRIRPRLRLPPLARDREFTPLLLMSPRRELLEETTLTTFPPMVTDSDLPRSIVRRRYHPPLPNLDEHGPRLLRSSYSPMADDDVEVRRQGRRQNSASSFEQVALASTSPTTPTTGSLSTLSNLSLPRPFDDGAAPAPAPTVPAATPAAEPPEPARGTTIIKVHERGIDASGPSFPVPVPLSSTNRGGGGLRRSPSQARGAAPFQFHFHFHAHQNAASSLSVEQGANPFLDEPLCESPVSFYPGVALSPPRIDPDDIRRVISAPIGCTQRVPVTFRSLPAA